jgi:hypothetical protein
VAVGIYSGGGSVLEKLTELSGNELGVAVAEETCYVIYSWPKESGRHGVEVAHEGVQFYLIFGYFVYSWWLMRKMNAESFLCVAKYLIVSSDACQFISELLIW